VEKYADKLLPEVTGLEARKSDMSGVWDINRDMARRQALSTGMVEGKHLFLPRKVAEEIVTKASPEVSGALGRVVGKTLPMVGGALAGSDLYGSAESLRNRDYENAAIQGLAGTGSMLMMLRHPAAIGAGALMQTPAMVRDYARSIAPILESDPRNAEFLLP
jgi:hypothetical protein